MQPTPSSTPPNAPPPDPQPPLSAPEVPGAPIPPKKSNKGLIVGLVAGGIVLFVLMGLGVAVTLTTLSAVQKRANIPGQNHMGTMKQTAQTKQSTSTCLALSDYANTFPTITEAGGELYQDIEIDTVFFLADSTDYQYANLMDDKYTTVAKFMKENDSKQFTIHLKGSVNGENGQAGGGALSTQRAEKVRDALIAKGADTSRLVVDPPAVYDQGENPSEFYQSVFRNVGIIVHDNCLSDQQ